MRKFRPGREILLRAAIATLASAGFADGAFASIVYSVDTTLAGVGPVDATASFTFGTNSVTVKLDNLLVDQKSVGENVSGLDFSLSNVTGLTLASQSYAQAVTVQSNGTPVFSAGGNPGWAFSNSPYGVSGLSGALYTPSRTILGAPSGLFMYDRANSSIAGSGPHNPFIYEEAVFVFDYTPAGLTQVLQNVQLNFGTGTNLQTAHRLPEPGTLALFGAGLIGLGWFGRRWRYAGLPGSRNIC